MVTVVPQDESYYELNVFDPDGVASLKYIVDLDTANKTPNLNSLG